jgi:hypothetical protein
LFRRAAPLPACLLVLAAAAARLAAANQDWIPWNPAPDDFKSSPIDLRPLNEKFAGENGWIQARGEQFVHSGNGRPVRFWAVNGDGGGDVTHGARVLAKYGVNLVRLHGGLYDSKTGELKSSEIKERITSIEALKGQGIYSLLSIYFPVWLKPKAGPDWREGYDGSKTPFALLYFEPEFQEVYRGWWKSILATKTSSGTALANEPAVMALELVNEDSLFFWTFTYKNIPDPQMRKLEKRFGDWAVKKHGSLRSALSAWNNLAHPRDDLAAGRLGFRPLYEMFTRKTPRDQATAAFLFEIQRDFYADTVRYIRSLGYKGLITASNWTTANNDIFGPLEKLSYMPGDFIDHHGYFGANHKGDNSAWSLREGHTYSDVSALRFDAEERGKPRAFFNPAMDPMYNRRPSMISEIAWNRPSRHRSEAPLFLSIYGSLQDTDAVVHFAFDSSRWAVKPGFFMQPWTLMSPTQAGQFPAAAFLYRRGLVKTGELMADLPMTIADALGLKGSRLVQQAGLDEFRKGDVGGDGGAKTQSRGIDPLIHLVGRTNVGINEKGGTLDTKDLTPFIDRTAQTVLSSTREIKLDYGKGVLALNAPAAQGVSGDLRKAGPVSLGDVTITSPLEVGHIIAVALDGQPLATSKRLLVQAMSEDKPSDFATEPAKEGVHRITRLGQDPWLMREIAGNVRFKRPDAARLKVTALDLNGYPVKEIGNAAAFDLLPGHVYYLISDGSLGK